MASWSDAAPALPSPRPRSRPKPQPAPKRKPRARRGVAGGVVWIAVVAVLLAGVVALNVAVLRVNMTLNKLNKQQLELQVENQSLASPISSAGSALRIEQVAHRFGLVPALAADTSYLDLSKR